MVLTSGENVRQIGKLELRGTEGRMVRIGIECRFDPGPDEVYQTRIFTNGAAPMAAYGVRIVQSQSGR